MAVLRSELLQEMERMFTENGRSHEQLASEIIQELRKSEVLGQHFETWAPILKSYVFIMADEAFTRGYRVGTPFEVLGELRLKHVEDKTLRASVMQGDGARLKQGLIESAETTAGLRQEMQAVLLEIDSLVRRLSHELRFGLSPDDLKRR